MEKEKRFLNRFKKNYIFEWGIAILVAIITLSFIYIDTKSLTIWSTNLWDVIAKGDITQYFAYTAENIYNAPHQYVSGTLYSLIVWGIWNLPIWAIQYFSGKPILSSAIMLIWSKMFLVVCLIGVIILAKKIIIEITENKEMAKLAMLLIFSSIWTYVGIFFAGQSEIIICLLGIMAVYALMKRKNKLFLILSGFAISVKYFFMFPFVALILLTEKNTYKIVGKVAIGLIPTIIFNLVCRGLPMYLESSTNGPMKKMLANLFVGNIPGFAGINISLFILSLIVIYFLAYITKPKEKEYKKFIIYFVALSFAPLLMFTGIQFYRMLLIIPFLIILLIQNKEKLKLNLILETVMEVAALIVLTCTTKTIWGPRYTENSILSKALALTKQNVPSLGQKICTKIPIVKTALPALSTVVIGMMIIMLVINHPRFNDKYLDVKEEKFERFWLWIKPLTILACVVATLYIMR